jgi:hypothetical protein
MSKDKPVELNASNFQGEELKISYLTSERYDISGLIKIDLDQQFLLFRV